MSDLHEEMESDEASDEECSFVDPFPNCRLSELVAQILGEDYVDKEKKEEENEYTNDPFENAHDVPTTFISYLGDFKYLFREPLPSIEESEFEDELAEETEVSQQTHIQNAFEPKSALAIGEDKNENKSCVIDTGELNVSNENFTSPSSEVEIATQTEPIQLDFDTDENNCIVRNNMIQSLDGETLSVEIESDKTHVKSHTVNNEDIDKEHGNASVNQNSCEDGLVCTKFSWSVTSV